MSRMRLVWVGLIIRLNAYHRNNSFMSSVLLLILNMFLCVWVFSHYLLVLQLVPELRHLHLFQNGEVRLKLHDLFLIKGKLLHEFRIVNFGHSVRPLVRERRKVWEISDCQILMQLFVINKVFIKCDKSFIRVKSLLFHVFLDLVHVSLHHLELRGGCSAVTHKWGLPICVWFEMLTE
jgi:hypothetical protein